jgi:hypothetical protein
LGVAAHAIGVRSKNEAEACALLLLNQRIDAAGVPSDLARKIPFYG